MLYRNLKFIELTQKEKTTVYQVLSAHDDTVLGFIEWTKWRQYTFEPTTEYATVWTAGCLSELINFIEYLMREHKMRKISVPA